MKPFVRPTPSAGGLLPGVDRVLTWSCPWIADPPPPVSARGIAELDALLDECRPTEAVILTSFHQSPLPLALLLRLAGVGTITGASVDHAGSLLDVRLRPGENLPETLPEALRALAIASAAGFPSSGPGHDRLAITATPELSGIAGAEQLAGVDEYLVVHPGASVPSRRWPAERFAEAVAALAERGMRVVVTGSPAERHLTARVAGSSALAKAAVVVTGNTGPAHLAAAVGTPVVSLFSPVVPAERWAPCGVPVVLLGDQSAACRDTRARECPLPGHPCLAAVRSDEVVAAVIRLLAGRPSTARREGAIA